MRKIIASAQISLDGVMQGQGSAQEDTSDGFDLGGWSMKFSDAKAGAAIMGVVGTLDKPYDLTAGPQDLRHFCRLLAQCSGGQPNWSGRHKSEQIRTDPGLGETRLGQQP